MPANLNVIPTEIIEAWAKGEYQLGDIPSLAYSQLGTALFLRSWYTYQDTDKRLDGIAKIDIKGPFLLIGGIRLIDNNLPSIVFWTSEVSHFVSENEIIWFHLVFRQDDANVKALQEKYIPKREVIDASAEGPARFGLTQDAWDALLDRLRTNFDTDVEQLRERVDQASIDRGMLRFPIKPQDGVHLCTYYQFYTKAGGETSLIQGTSRFQKVSRS